jgi:DNA topoisomerase-1
MSWQQPAKKKCPQCGGYMLIKGQKLLCANENCGYVCEREKDENEDG